MLKTEFFSYLYLIQFHWRVWVTDWLYGKMRLFQERGKIWDFKSRLRGTTSLRSDFNGTEPYKNPLTLIFHDKYLEFFVNQTFHMSWKKWLLFLLVFSLLFYFMLLSHLFLSVFPKYIFIHPFHSLLFSSVLNSKENY